MQRGLPLESGESKLQTKMEFAGVCQVGGLGLSLDRGFGTPRGCIVTLVPKKDEAN